jgi:hypothetical protein
VVPKWVITGTKVVHKWYQSVPKYVSNLIELLSARSCHLKNHIIKEMLFINNKKIKQKQKHKMSSTTVRVPLLTGKYQPTLRRIGGVPPKRTKTITDTKTIKETETETEKDKKQEKEITTALIDLMSYSEEEKKHLLQEYIRSTVFVPPPPPPVPAPTPSASTSAVPAPAPASDPVPTPSASTSAVPTTTSAPVSVAPAPASTSTASTSAPAAIPVPTPATTVPPIALVIDEEEEEEQMSEEEEEVIMAEYYKEKEEERVAVKVQEDEKILSMKFSTNTMNLLIQKCRSNLIIIYYNPVFFSSSVDGTAGGAYEYFATLSNTNVTYEMIQKAFESNAYSFSAEKLKLTLYCCNQSNSSYEPVHIQFISMHSSCSEMIPTKNSVYFAYKLILGKTENLYFYNNNGTNILSEEEQKIQRKRMIETPFIPNTSEDEPTSISSSRVYSKCNGMAFYDDSIPFNVNNQNLKQYLNTKFFQMVRIDIQESKQQQNSKEEGDVVENPRNYFCGMTYYSERMPNELQSSSLMPMSWRTIKERIQNATTATTAASTATATATATTTATVAQKHCTCHFVLNESLLVERNSFPSFCVLPKTKKLQITHFHYCDYHLQQKSKQKLSFDIVISFFIEKETAKESKVPTEILQNLKWSALETKPIGPCPTQSGLGWNFTTLHEQDQWQ